MESPAYLDAIFSALHRFSEERKASQRWTKCALGTTDLNWRMTFLRAARAAHEAARRHLAEAASGVGPAPAAGSFEGDSAPPLAILSRRLVALEAELEEEEERLSNLETASLSSGEAPRWTA
jgi:hypothetical protein